MSPELHKEVYMAAAADTSYFCHTFFPKTFRQADSPDARQVFRIAEDINIPFAMLLMYRGSSKTTKAKGILAKRVSYGISKTIMLVSQSQGHSIKTLTWLRKQVMYNKKWADFYGLSPAMDPYTGRPQKWTDEWICIRHKALNTDINIVAVGIEGQTRGLNIDDFRPDFILGDDIADDLNSGSPGPRQQVIDTWTGSIEKTLAPKSENPFAKILILQTPIAEGDIVDAIKKDPRYHVYRMPIFVPDENGNMVSAWPARWSTEDLLVDKQAHIQAGKLRMWMREMELELIDSDNQLLSSKNLEFTDTLPDLTKGILIISIDPTPPPKMGKPKPVNEKLDDTAVIALYADKETRMVVDRETCKSPSTTDILEIVFAFVKKWKPIKVGIETILFARTLAEDIVKEQAKRGIFFAVQAVEDKRAKPIRIVTEITKWTEHRTLKILSNMSDIYAQWCAYDGNPTKHDDLLDAISIGLMIAEQLSPIFDSIEGEYRDITDDQAMPAIEYEDEAP